MKFNFTRLLRACKEQVQSKQGQGAKVESQRHPRIVLHLHVHRPSAPAQHQQNPHQIQVWTFLKCVYCPFSWYQQFQTAISLYSSVTGSKTTSTGEVNVFVDLAYIPSGASSPTVSVDFFRCVRSSCYIISGDSPEREELMRHTLDALLDGKISWPDPMQVESRNYRFCKHLLITANPFFLYAHPSFFFVTLGDSDSYLWVSVNAGVVPADPGQTEGARHHCSGIQQHCRYAGRDLSRLQDRVLNAEEMRSLILRGGEGGWIFAKWEKCECEGKGNTWESWGRDRV